MSDIVWKLLNDVPCVSDIGCAWELCNQAADEIDEGCPCSACQHSALARTTLEVK